MRMPERCDPYIYFNRVRPYIHGWANHPALPAGMLYEGIDEYGGALRGKSFAAKPALKARLFHRSMPRSG